MTTPLVLVGAGGFGRETVELIRAINTVDPTWDLLGFVDDSPDLAGTERSGLPVLGPIEWLHANPNAHATLCLGSPSTNGLRRAVARRLDLPSDRYATLVHPAAVISPSVEIGVGTVVHATTVCTADIVLGSHVEIMPAVVLTHDDLVGDFVTFGAGARVAGGVTIEDEVYVGSGACIREGLSVGAGALVGMGSVVTRSIPAGEVWAGSPARRLHSSAS